MPWTRGGSTASRLQNAGWTNFTQDHLDYHHDEAVLFRGQGAHPRPDPARRAALLQQPGGGRGACAVTVSRGCPSRCLAPPTLTAEAIAAKPFLALEHNRANYALARALADGVLGPGAREDWRHLNRGRWPLRVPDRRQPDHRHRLRPYPGRPGDHPQRHPRRLPRGQGRDPVRLRRGPRPRQAPPDGGRGGALVGPGHRDLGQPAHRGPRGHHRATSSPACAGQAPEVVVDRPQAVARLFDLLAARPPDEPWVALIAGKGHERYYRPQRPQDLLQRPG